MKHIYFLSIAALLCCNTFSQNQFDFNWVFGENAGLNFSSGSPEYFAAEIMSAEACASISDSLGNLLFYTNGEEVYNKEFEIMPNGDGLLIGQINPFYGSSITQGVIILPKPENNHLFYIFYLAYKDTIAGLRYSILDMTLNGGLGDIVEKNKIVFTDTTQEKMTAIKHANGRDWWLLTRKYFEYEPGESDLIFTRILLTPDGISGPFDQDYGPDYEFGIDNDMGQMIFSSENNKLIYPRGDFLNFYDFDRCSGLLSNYVVIDELLYGIYGVSFSPDGSKFYISGSCDKKLYQYCLNCDGIPVADTKTLIYEGPEGPYCLGQHLLAPDGKIYFATVYNSLPNSVYSPKNQNLSVINFPNELYPDCDVDTNTISIAPGRIIDGGLPNMPNYNLGALAGSECDTLGVAINHIINKGEITTHPNPANTFITITSHLNNYLNTTAEIYNAAGVKVKEINVVTSNQKINVEELAAGMYSIVVKQNKNYLYNNKLVIIK